MSTRCVLLMALLVTACSSTSAPSIVGAWDGQGEAGTGTSLTFHEDGTALWVLDPVESRARLRPVEIGVEIGSEVEVLDGLNLSDKIIDGGRERLEEGTPVKIEGTD